MLVPKSFTDLITFSRSSAGWYFNSAGVLVQAGANIPRFDHDPVTRQPRGLLIEEGRTNLLLRSQEFDNAVWTRSRIGVSPNTAVAPDGTMTADKLVPTAENNNHGLGQNVALAGAVQCSWSVYAKAAEYFMVRLRLSDSVSFLADVLVNLNTGTIQNPNAASSIQYVGNGWYRICVTWTPAAASTLVGHGVWVYDENGSPTFTGDGVKGLYAWGAQLEQGYFPTSYIPTTSAQVARNADFARITDLTKMYFAAGKGSMAIDAEVGALGNAAVSSNSFPHIGALTKNNSIGAGDYAALRLSPAVPVGIIGNAGVYNTRSLGGDAAVGKVLKLALAGDGNDVVLARDGTLSSPFPGGAWPSDVSELWLGSQGGSSRFWNGWIRGLRYWPYRLSNAQLQAVTA